jgi:hypothetical protein
VHKIRSLKLEQQARQHRHHAESLGFRHDGDVASLVVQALTT